MELAGDEILDLTSVRRIHKGETVDQGIACGSCLGAIHRRGFADNEGKGEYQIVLVVELEQKCRAPGAVGCFWVLNPGVNNRRTSKDRLRMYLDELDWRVVA
jgi:hypothetical protein